MANRPGLGRELNEEQNIIGKVMRHEASYEHLLQGFACKNDHQVDFVGLLFV